jgi:hypothetical protein
MDKEPKWQGKLLDANGRVGKLEMNVDAERGRGTVTVELLERDGKPAVFRNEITLEGGAAAEIRVRSSAQESATTQQTQGKLEWEANLNRADAGRYAKAAMLGSYSVANGGPELPLSTGVMILWQFS